MSALDNLQALYVTDQGAITSLRDGSPITPEQWAQLAREKRERFGIGHDPVAHSVTCLVSLGFYNEDLAAVVVVGIEEGLAGKSHVNPDPWFQKAMELGRSWRST